MTDQFNRESWEIYHRSDVLWEEKEMLWFSSLGERQNMLHRLPEQSESESSESDEPWSPSTDALLGFDHHDNNVTGQASTSS